MEAVKKGTCAVRSAHFYFFQPERTRTRFIYYLLGRCAGHGRRRARRGEEIGAPAPGPAHGPQGGRARRSRRARVRRWVCFCWASGLTRPS